MIKKYLFLLVTPLIAMANDTAQDYYALAQLHKKSGNNEMVIHYLEQTVLHNPNNVIQRFELANFFAQIGFYEKAVNEYKKLESLVSCSTPLDYNIAFCLKSSGYPEQALDYYIKVLQQNPYHDDARQGLATTLLTLGYYEKAWPFFEHRWSSPRPDSRRFTQYLHTHNDLTGKKVALKAEFGLGDTFQFIRYATILKQKGATIIAQVQSSLVPLLKLCPYIDQTVATNEPLPPCDFETVLMSLPWACKTTLETIPTPIPYLWADKNLTDAWHTKLAHDANFKIGLCWHGNVYNTQQLQKLVAEKSIPLSLLAPLGNNKNVSIYSLQKIGGLEEVAHNERMALIHFENLDQEHGPFMDTASIMMHMDLIITIDTSIAHLAGALGKRVWLMVPFNADWRWLKDRSDSPWYPTMKLFRQKIRGDWSTVIDEIQASLQELLSTHNPCTLQELISNGCKAYENGDLALAYSYFNSLVSRAPHDVNILYNAAGIQRRLNNLSEAIALYNKALALNAHHENASFGLAQAYLAQGDNEKGWHLFNKWRPAAVASLPQLDALNNKTILITAEWGLGDMLHFIRYAQLLKNLNATVIVQAHTNVAKLLQLCPFIDHVIPAGSPLPKADFSVPLLCLPTLFETSNTTIPTQIPYLKADQNLIDEWGKKVAESPAVVKVGLCWDIGHHDTKFIGWQRSIALELLAPLASCKDVQFYSLQHHGSTDIAKVKKAMNIIEFENFDTASGGFMDSAALMHHLDVVITVDTSIAHLAGGLGIPTWTLLPYSPDYRWTLQGQTTPWYPTMKLFRQTKAGDWQDVVEKVKKELIGVVTKKRPNKEIIFAPIESVAIEKLYKKHQTTIS